MDVKQKKDSWSTIRTEVLREHAGGKEALSRVKPIIQTISRELAKKHIKANVMIGGSVAKMTHLRNEFDCDLFVQFDKKYAKENLSDLLAKALKPIKTERVHGSRDYFMINKEIEVVPVLKISKASEALNVTDFSPMHVAWARKALGKKLREEVIIAKVFCRAQEVYGAESYIHGFSGHVIDILIVNYGGFLPLVRAACKWRPKTFIDVKKHGTKLEEFNHSKIEGPLVVVDPIQPYRNASAAVSEETYHAFIRACREFLKKPGKEFFIYKQLSIEEIRKNRYHIIFDVGTAHGKEDIIGAKLIKAYETITKELEEFGIIKKGWWWDRDSKAYFWYVFTRDKLAPSIEREGPPVDMKKFATIFRKKYRKTHVRNGRLYATVPRDKTLLLEHVRSALDDPSIKERVARISILQ